MEQAAKRAAPRTTVEYQLGVKTLATVAPEAATTVARVGPLARLYPGGSDNTAYPTRASHCGGRRNWTYVALKLDIDQGWPSTPGDLPLTSLHQSIEVAL